MLTDEQYEALQRAYTGDSGKELKKLFEWAEDVVTKHSLLHNAFNGHVVVSWENGEPAWRISEEGAKHFDKLLLRPGLNS